MRVEGLHNLGGLRCNEMCKRNVRSEGCRSSTDLGTRSGTHVQALRVRVISLAIGSPRLSSPTYEMMGLDVQQEGRDHGYRFLSRDVSLSRRKSPARERLLVLYQDSGQWSLTISVSPTRKLWNTLYSGLFLIVLLGTFNCQAKRSGYHSSCLGAG